MREIIEIDGVKRFKQNRIINVLLDLGKLTVENIWSFYEYGMFELEDLEEFFQLIGFSIEEYNQIKEFNQTPGIKIESKELGVQNIDVILKESEIDETL